MELKTLKEWSEYSSDRAMVVNSLREIAITWVNHLRRCNRDLQLPRDTIEVNWIIQFFNLKEEELNSPKKPKRC